MGRAARPRAVLPLAFTLALLGPPAMSPQTTVELRVTSVDDGAVKLLEQALQRQLGDRLLEDGYRVVPPGREAGVHVWIHLEVGRATIDTHGASHRIETVAGGDPAVVGLEIQQLTTALIDEVKPAHAEAQPAVVLDVAGAPTDPELRVRLQNGLLARGFPLTRRPVAGDRRLCVTAEPSGAARLDVVDAAGPCATGPNSASVPPGPSIERTRELLLTQATASLAAALAPTTNPPPPTRENAPPPREIAPSARESAPSPADPRALAIALTAHGGLLARVGGGPDGLVGLGARFGRRRGLGGGLELTLIPSGDERVGVLEATPTATLDGRIGVREHGLVVLSAFAGAHVHRYAHRGLLATTGTRVGASVGATIRLGWQSRRGGLLLAGLRAGWSGGRWVHLVDGKAGWRRSGLMLGLEVSAGWDFVVPRRRR